MALSDISIALASQGVKHEIVLAATSVIGPKELSAIKEDKQFVSGNGNVVGSARFGGTGHADQEEVTAAKKAGADYWISSYGTPIAYRLKSKWFMLSGTYSKTTSRHQKDVAYALNAVASK